MTFVDSQHRAFAPSHALLSWALGGLLVAAVTACSESEADTRTHDTGARQEDAGRDAGRIDAGAPIMDAATDRPFDGTCSGIECPDSDIGTPCCTSEGAGMSGHVLENTGRAPGLCGRDVGNVLPSLAGICVQLRQPGSIDSECPAQEQLGGGLVMPGCCTDEGYCGSLETLVGFGCFYATGRKGRPCTPDADVDGVDGGP